MSPDPIALDTKAKPSQAATPTTTPTPTTVASAATTPRGGQDGSKAATHSKRNGGNSASTKTGVGTPDSADTAATTTSSSSSSSSSEKTSPTRSGQKHRAQNKLPPLIQTTVAEDDEDERRTPPEIRATAEENSISAKTRRGSLPRISSLDAQPKTTPKASTTSSLSPADARHSMTEVVARMNVREQTLLGEDLLRRREKDTLGAAAAAADTGGGNDDPHRRSSAFSSVTIVNPDGTVKTEYTSTTEARRSARIDSMASHQPGPKLSRTVMSRRKYGVLEPIPAWGTPRNPPHVAPQPLQNRPLRGTDFSGKGGLYLSTGGVFASGEEEEEEEVVKETPVVAESPDSPDTLAMKSFDIDDDNFDYDKGEDVCNRKKEIVAAEREAKRKSRATDAVYHRACQALIIEPRVAVLRQCNVTSMTLRDVHLSPADVKPISIALVRDRKVHSLDLSYNNIGALGVCYIAEMLQENKGLRDVDLSATNPGREGVKALSETLRHNRSLTMLRLEDNKIEHTESQFLADIIRHVSGLQEFYLGHNNLGYKGCAAIAKALAHNKSLLSLDLRWNHIRRDSAKELANALSINEYLRSLNLAWNGLGKQGCLALAYALPENVTLRELDLTCNRVDMQSLSFLLHGLMRNRVLKKIKVGQNPLTTEGAKGLIKAIGESGDSGITEVDVTGVPVDQTFIDMVNTVQESRFLEVAYDDVVTLSTTFKKREFKGTNLDRYDPLMVLFEYMKMDNLRVVDMFQYMDSKKRDKLSKANIRDGLNTLRIPVNEHSIDVIHRELDMNQDGFVTLDEMIKMQRVTASMVKQRQIRAKQRKREDMGLTGLHKILRDVIAKRSEQNEMESRMHGEERRGSAAVSMGWGGGRRRSSGGTEIKAGASLLLVTTAIGKFKSSRKKGKPLSTIKG